MSKNTNKVSPFQKARAMVNFINEGTRLGVPNVNERIVNLLDVADQVDAVLERVRIYNDFRSIKFGQEGYYEKADPLFRDVVYTTKQVFNIDEKGCKTLFLDTFKNMEQMKDVLIFGNINYKATLAQLEYYAEFLKGFVSRIRKYLDFINYDEVKIPKKRTNQLIVALQSKQKQLRDLAKKSVVNQKLIEQGEYGSYLGMIDYILNPKTIKKGVLYNGKEYREYVAFVLEDIESFMDDLRKLDKKMTPFYGLGNILDKQKVETR